MVRSDKWPNDPAYARERGPPSSGCTTANKKCVFSNCAHSTVARQRNCLGDDAVPLRTAESKAKMTVLNVENV